MAILFQTLYYSWGAYRSYLATGFLLVLAFQLSFRSNYFAAPDYVTRTSPTYDPNPSNIQAPGTGLIGAVLGLVVKLLNGLSGFLRKVPDNACERSKHGSDLTFDFIVVGAGAAGSAIAACLSANDKWNVLLVEAGGDSVIESVVPQLFTYGLNNTRIWRYSAEKTNTSCQAYKNGCPMPCGKQLSGGTGTNAMMWVCGQKRDYDGWAAEGNDGWSYDEMLPYIMATERNVDKSKNLSYHGTKGAITVSTNVYEDPFKNALINGYSALGYKILDDINQGEYNGYADIQSSVKKGERCSAYQGFIQPIKNKQNLFIAKNSLVTKILLNGKKAIGVRVQTSRSDCKFINFKASKETIISAGALNSPGILMRSGIGPEDHLKSVGAPFVLDLPGVGQNFQDHIYGTYYLSAFPNAKAQGNFDLFKYSAQYIALRRGYFSHLSTVNANGFINANDVNDTDSNIQIIANRIDRSQEDFAKVWEDFGLKDEFIAQLLPLGEKTDIVQVYVTLLNPNARGKIELRDNNPESKPKITGNFFENEEDIETILGGIRKFRELVNTEAFQNITQAKFIKFNIQDCNGLPYPSDEYDRCYIKHFSAVLWHPSGTCKMGPSSDPLAVVDASLKVHGIENLRVADAGIMPKVTSGNTQCPCYAIGQKACALIKKSWK